MHSILVDSATRDDIIAAAVEQYVTPATVDVVTSLVDNLIDHLREECIEAKATVIDTILALDYLVRCLCGIALEEGIVKVVTDVTDCDELQ